MTLEIFAQPKSVQKAPPPIARTSAFDPRPSHFERQLQKQPTRHAQARREQDHIHNRRSERPRNDDRTQRSDDSWKKEDSIPSRKRGPERDDHQHHNSATPESNTVAPWLHSQIIAATPAEETITTNGDEVLETLSKLYQEPATLRRDAPILSILTGHVEEIEPQAMPGMVLGNGFIQEAMSFEDINNFLDTPIDLAEMLDDLGLTDIASKLEQMSLTSGGEKTPREILGALGLDAQSVLSELKLLQGYLNTDGLNPYMVRAAALRGSKLGDNPNDPMMMPMGPLAANATQAKGPSFDQVPIIQELPTNQMEEEMPLGPWEHGSLSEIRDMRALADASGLDNPVVTVQTPRSANPEPMQGNLPPIDVNIDESAQGPSIASSSEDLFGNMEKSWQQNSVQSTSFTGQKPLAESLEQLKLQGQEPISGPVISNDEQIQLAEEAEIANEPFISFEGNELDQQSSSEVQALGSNTSNSDSEGSRQDGEPEQSHQDDSINFMSGTRAPAATAQARPFEVEMESQAESVQDSKQVRDTVFERAQMLIKDGGGTIKLDLGTKELGQLDLAIDVQDDTLKVRITADSDKAREMLSQELPALRQALADQSLDLKTVEIGLRHEEQWTQSSNEQQENQSQSQQQQDQGDDQTTPLMPNISWNQARKSITQQLKTSISRPHSGNIQIRV